MNNIQPTPLPRFLICRECPEIPGCETIIERLTGSMAKILRFNNPEDADNYRNAYPESYQISGYNIYIESISRYAPIVSMGLHLQNHIQKHSSKFKKFKIA